jgi:putative membrane protein
MLKLLLKWLLSACALLAVAYLYSGVQVSGFAAAMWAALFIGLLNALVRPILFILTLPITILTLGLFFFVLNAAMFYAASGVIDGFAVRSFGAALLGSILYSIAGVIIDSALEGLQLGRLP